uniref:G-protein coupled receptors family 1 profile domain-containing protein n=1 Tax=Ditylenchus dipsaci TaxID=166011 RepID=A0A915DEP3_9BILA
MCSNSVQFIYRYLAICRDTHVSAIKYFGMLGIAGLFTLYLATFAAFSCYQSSLDLDAQSLNIKRNIEVEGIHITCIIRSDLLLQLLHSVNILLFTIVCYSFIFICGFKIRKLIKQHSKSRKTENDRQMTLMLILQAILPFIAGCIDKNVLNFATERNLSKLFCIFCPNPISKYHKKYVSQPKETRQMCICVLGLLLCVWVFNPLLILVWPDDFVCFHLQKKESLSPLLR